MINNEYNYFYLIEKMTPFNWGVKIELKLIKKILLENELKIIYLIYMCKEDLVLNNLQWLICQKTKLNLIYLIYLYKEDLALNNLQGWICHKTQPNQILYI